MNVLLVRRRPANSVERPQSATRAAMMLLQISRAALEGRVWHACAIALRRGSSRDPVQPKGRQRQTQRIATPSRAHGCHLHKIPRAPPLTIPAQRWKIRPDPPNARARTLAPNACRICSRRRAAPDDESEWQPHVCPTANRANIGGSRRRPGSRWENQNAPMA